MQPPTAAQATTVMPGPPRPPMGPHPDATALAGPIVVQDRPHERPYVGSRRPARTGAAAYAKSLAPLVGMSIVVVVVIAGVTAWISSFQERETPTVPRPAADITAPAAPITTVAPSPKVSTSAKPKAKAVAPTTKAPAKTTTKAPVTTTAPKATTTQRGVAPSSGASSSADEDTPATLANRRCNIFIPSSCD
ncbi:hypothetical protein [Pseudonocardia thermophila]|uniref:hypothetical protein n=1 Tax=Pseudonocardia thermophila TaxID=1848 RepID=UPI000937BF6B|nr:hypothetical protein [Pseudonocardia thermophila]